MKTVAHPALVKADIARLEPNEEWYRQVPFFGKRFFDEEAGENEGRLDNGKSLLSGVAESS